MSKPPTDLSIASFDYHLPHEKVPLRPAEQRSGSKLLVWQQGQPATWAFNKIGKLLPADSLVVFNNSRVVPARLIFYKPSGGRIEIFCLEPAAPDVSVAHALQERRTVDWKCFVGNASSWPATLVLSRETGGGALLTAERIAREQDHYIVRLSWSSGESFGSMLEKAGLIPLPPYIKREPESADADRYQTVYARAEGSVAAPTAGLHFTPAILEELSHLNIRQAFVTLHVGAGTFLPVKSATMEGHDMHSEYIEVTKDLILTVAKQKKNNLPVVAVGTTSLRTLESLYWLGNLIANDPSIDAAELFVEQWSPYENRKKVPLEHALQALLNWLEERGGEKLIARTALLIAPSYKFAIVDALVTNFHQPKSTLLLLVAAFIGEDWRKVYEYALENDFRFLSYGDSSLLFRH